MVKKKYIPGSAAFFPTGPDCFISYNYNTGKTSFIDKTDANNYSQLTGIKTISQHIIDLEKIYNTGSENKDIDYIFSSLLETNLLYPLESSKIHFSETEQESALSIITSDRPELLSSALNSIAEKIHSDYKNLPVIVFDDSSSQKIIDENKILCINIKNNYGLNISHFGIKEKHQLLKLLYEENTGTDKSIIRFAVMGSHDNPILKGPGGNRNTALLKLAGCKIISFDDDTKYDFFTHSNLEDDLEISNFKDPESHVFCKTTEAEKNLISSEIDPLRYINNILGKSVGEIIEKTVTSNNELLTDNFRPDSFFSLKRWDSSIKAAFLGIYGGRWFSRPFGVYFNNKPDRYCGFRNKSEYSKIKENPISLMLPEHLTLSRAPFFITTAMGIDSGEILPPYPPYGRNQDGIWIAVMLALNQNTFVSHIPLAIYHEMSNKSFFTEEDYTDTSAGFGIITVLAIEHLRKNLGSKLNKISYQALGNQLVWLSQISDEDFLFFFHKIWLEYAGNAIADLEKKLAENKRKPKYWARDTEEYIMRLEKQSLVPENSLPKELRKNYSLDDAIKQYKCFFRDYGNLLINWPDIWDKALKFNKKKETQF